MNPFCCCGLLLLTVLGQDYAYSDMKTATWIKRVGFWGFLFFLVKGLLWLIVPALAVYLAN
jgi:hypothetical protein